MSRKEKPAVGDIVWTDLTVQDAAGIKDFYRQVVGWTASPHDMGDYHDFDIKTPADGQIVAGICHARGANANIPGQWLIYILVEDVDESANRCQALGGRIVDGPRAMGQSRFCVIEDPAGAVAALIDQGSG
jgi:predicted enzyme related to lactoylglutathione lyase